MAAVDKRHVLMKIRANGMLTMLVFIVSLSLWPGLVSTIPCYHNPKLTGDWCVCPVRLASSQLFFLTSACEGFKDCPFQIFHSRFRGWPVSNSLLDTTDFGHSLRSSLAPGGH